MPCPRGAFFWSQDGADGWLPVRISIVRLSAEPSAIAVLSAQNRSDAVRWKLAEAELLESQNRFEAFMNAIPMLGFMKDAAGRMVYVNQAFTDRFALPAEHFLGKLDHELFPAEVARKLRDTDLRVMAGTKPVELANRCPPPTESSRMVGRQVPLPRCPGPRLRRRRRPGPDRTPATRRRPPALRRTLPGPLAA